MTNITPLENAVLSRIASEIPDLPGEQARVILDTFRAYDRGLTAQVADLVEKVLDCAQHHIPDVRDAEGRLWRYAPKADCNKREVTCKPTTAGRVVVFEPVGEEWAAIMAPGWTEFGGTPAEAMEALLAKFGKEWAATPKDPVP